MRSCPLDTSAQSLAARRPIPLRWLYGCIPYTDGMRLYMAKSSSSVVFLFFSRTRRLHVRSGSFRFLSPARPSPCLRAPGASLFIFCTASCASFFRFTWRGLFFFLLLNIFSVLCKISRGPGFHPGSQRCGLFLIRFLLPAHML